MRPSWKWTSLVVLVLAQACAVERERRVDPRADEIQKPADEKAPADGEKAKDEESVSETRYARSSDVDEIERQAPLDAATTHGTTEDR